MSIERVNEHTFPGRRHHRSPGELRPAERLIDRLNLTVLAATGLGDGPKRLGLLAWQLSDGEMPLRAGLVHDVGTRDGRILDRLARWAERNPLSTDLGPTSRHFDPLPVFNVEIFLRHAYRGRATTISAHSGRTIALQSSYHVAARRAQWRGGWAFGLAGAGRAVKRARRDGSYGEEWWSSPHQPMVRAKSLGSHAVKIAFAACPPMVKVGEHGERIKTPAGVWVPGRDGKDHPYEGRWVDVVPVAGALGGPDSDALDEHLGAFGLPSVDAPAAVTLDGRGAEQLTSAVEAIHRFAMLLDRTAGTR